MSKQIEALGMAQEVPLTERLRKVPENARLIVDSADGMSSSVHAVGYLCHKAAESLAEAEKQEPVAWMEEYQSCKVNGDERLCHSDKVFRLVQLLASQSKEWQSLSDDNILKLFKPKFECEIEDFELIDFSRAIEQALKEKNHG